MTIDNVPSDQAEGPPPLEPVHNLHIKGFGQPPKIFYGVKLITFDLVTNWEFANRRIKPFGLSSGDLRMEHCQDQVLPMSLLSP